MALDSVEFEIDIVQGIHPLILLVLDQRSLVFRTVRKVSFDLLLAARLVQLVSELVELHLLGQPVQRQLLRVPVFVVRVPLDIVQVLVVLGLHLTD